MYPTRLISILCISFISFTVNAQSISGGLRAGFTSYLSVDVQPILIGIQGEYSLDEGLGFRTVFNYGKAGNSDTYQAFAFSSATIPNSINISGESNFTDYHLGLDAKKYVASGSYEHGGLYIILGLGFTALREAITFDYGPFPRSEYSVTGATDEEDPQNFYQYSLRVGFGYELDVNVGKLFIEPRFIFPSSSSSRSIIRENIGTNAGVVIGIRI